MYFWEMSRSTFSISHLRLDSRGFWHLSTPKVPNKHNLGALLGHSALQNAILRFLSSRCLCLSGAHPPLSVSFTRYCMRSWRHTHRHLFVVFSSMNSCGGFCLRSSTPTTVDEPPRSLQITDSSAHSSSLSLCELSLWALSLSLWALSLSLSLPLSLRLALYLSLSLYIYIVVYIYIYIYISLSLSLLLVLPLFTSLISLYLSLPYLYLSRYLSPFALSSSLSYTYMLDASPFGRV